MIKHLNGWDMFKKVPSMKCYVKPLLRGTPNHFILHVGTNDLNFNQTSEVIAKEIIYLATSLKNNQQDVNVSNIILRIDNSKLNVKRCEVNQFFIRIIS